jgi:hypothetical protein
VDRSPPEGRAPSRPGLRKTDSAEAVPPTMKTEPNRKSPVHLAAREIFNVPVVVFLTVCTKGRKPILADNETHALLLEAWRTAGAWFVGRYVILPDHLHLFCAPTEHESLPILTGLHSGSRTRQDDGPIPKSCRFGNVIFGTDNCGAAKAMMRSGITLSRIQFGLGWSRDRKIGHTKAR